MDTQQIETLAFIGAACAAHAIDPARITTSQREWLAGQSPKTIAAYLGARTAEHGTASATATTEGEPIPEWFVDAGGNDRLPAGELAAAWADYCRRLEAVRRDERAARESAARIDRLRNARR